MKANWPVEETRRASFILGAVVLALVTATATTAHADARGLVVAARNQDPRQIDAWRTALGGGTPAERAAAAFALGQLGMAWEPVGEEARARAETALLAALAGEKDAAVRDRLVEALGKVGKAPAATAIVALLDGKERVRAAVAAATLAKSKVPLGAGAREKLEALLGDKDAQARAAAALALLRLRDPASHAALRGCTRDAAVHVRATCAKALADVGDEHDADVLAPLTDDADGRVAAEAARTLTKLAARCTDGGCRTLGALQNMQLPWRPSVVQAVTFEHPRGLAAAALLRAAYEAMPKASGLDERTRAILGCKLAMARDRAAGTLDLVPKCGAGERERGVWAAEALAEVGGPELAKLAASPHAAVREAAAEGADAATVVKLLGDDDAPVVAAAAERAEALKLATAAPQLRAALARVKGPDAVEAQQSLLAAAAALKLTALVPDVRALVDAEPYALRQAAAHALTALTGTATVARPPAPAADEAAAAPPTAGRGRGEDEGEGEGDRGESDDRAAEDHARHHSRAAVDRRCAAHGRQLRRARTQEVLRQAAVSSRGAELRVAGRRPARRRRRRAGLRHPLRDRHAPLRRGRDGDGAVGARHRWEPVLLHARPRAAPRRALYSLRRDRRAGST